MTFPTELARGDRVTDDVGTRTVDEAVPGQLTTEVRWVDGSYTRLRNDRALHVEPNIAAHLADAHAVTEAPRTEAEGQHLHKAVHALGINVSHDHDGPGWGTS